MIPNTSEDVAAAFARFSLKTPDDGPFASPQLPYEVILDIIELLQETYVAQEEPTESHPLINLRL
jgi:hypothetical protein